MLLNTEFTKGKIIVPTFVDCAKIILLLINRLLLISFKIEEEKKEGASVILVNCSNLNSGAL